MKSLVNKFVPFFLKSAYRSYKNRKVINYFETDFEKKVLISYITMPFRRQSLEHSNNYEAISAAAIFNELGYQVDIQHYEDNVVGLKDYNVIYGFGDVFKCYFESGLVSSKTIYYGTGMHVCHQNSSTLKRVKEVYEKRGVWLPKSSRFVEKTWTHQTSLIDGIIALGNEECKKTYEMHYDGPVIALSAPFYKTLNGFELIKRRTVNARNSFLWFGSAGLIHKGLDLCLEYFSTRPDLTLYICGDVFFEPDFVEVFHKELFETPNIKVQGFVSIDSLAFEEILQSCSFAILPSCSEGGGVSVLTAVGNGGLIPIVTVETSVSTGYEIVIKSLDYKGVEGAVLCAESLTDEDVINIQEKNLEFVLKNHSQENYYFNLKMALARILTDAV